MKIEKYFERDWWAIWFEAGEDRDDYARNMLVVYAFGRAWYITFDKIWIKPKSYEHTGKYNYTQTVPMKWGFLLSEGNFLQAFYGIQCDGMAPELKNRRKSWFLPWASWKHTYHKLLNLDETEWMDVTELNSWEYTKDQESISFLFKDFDGEEITAKCTVEKRRWDRGEGYFQFLKYFYKPKINTYLELAFSSEVGEEKGSWKGGTVGHSTIIEPHEYLDDCFERYCIENNLEFVKEIK